MIRGVHHVAISTPNLERIVAFYRDVVGAEVVYEAVSYTHLTLPTKRIV